MWDLIFIKYVHVYRQKFGKIDMLYIILYFSFQLPWQQSFFFTIDILCKRWISYWIMLQILYRHVHMMKMSFNKFKAINIKWHHNITRFIIFRNTCKMWQSCDVYDLFTHMIHSDKSVKSYLRLISKWVCGKPRQSY